LRPIGLPKEKYRVYLAFATGGFHLYVISVSSSSAEILISKRVIIGYARIWVGALTFEVFGGILLFIERLIISFFAYVAENKRVFTILKCLQCIPLNTDINAIGVRHFGVFKFEQTRGWSFVTERRQIGVF
jgi:hypothetical protein